MSSHSPWLRLRVPLGFLFAAWYIAVAKPSSAALLAATGVLAALGCALRAWAAGYLLKGKRVAVGGPYAYVRHPQYLAFIAVMFGFLLQWPTLLTLLMFPVLVIAYGRLARSEERESLQRLGDAYRQYTQTTPAFWPRISQLRRSATASPASGK